MKKIELSNGKTVEMREPKVAIIDYEMCNLFSVTHACLNSGLIPVITRDPGVIDSADAVILPGVGAIGGGITTIADALKGAQDGWDKEDTANLAVNLGFTAASAIGLGGLKALQLGAKAVKAGKIARTASEVAENSSKVSNVVRKALTSPYLQKSVQAASTVGRGALVAIPAVSSAQGIYKSVSSAPEDMNW